MAERNMNIDRDGCCKGKEERSVTGNDGGERLFLLRARLALRW